MDEFEAAFFQTDELAPLAPTGTGSFDWASMAREAGGVLKDIYVTATQADAQRQIIDLNAERARRGLPPLSAEYVSPQVNVGMSPATRTLVTYGAIGLAAVYLLPQLMKGRRR